MDQSHRGDADLIPDQNSAHKQPDHLRNFQNNLQPRHPSDNDVSYQRLDLTFANIILPVSFLGVTVLAILFVLVLLILWWKNFASSWKAKKKNEELVKTMAEFDDSKVKIEVLKDTSKIVKDSESEEERPNVKYVDEKEQRLRPIVTTRNYGGSSPKFPDTTEQKEHKPTKFVFPPEKSESDQSSSKSSQPSSSGSSNEDKNPTQLKIPLSEQSWLNKKPFEVKTYIATIPRPLAEVVKSELGVDLSVQECHGKKFSATRSPSLEKDDKSPFVSSATYDNSEVFGFEPEAINKVSTNSSVIDVCVQPKSDQAINVVDKNFNNNVTPISPIPNDARDLRRYIPAKIEHLRTSSLDVDSENKTDAKNTNLRRFRSVNTKLNICAAIDHSNFEAQQERLEMQNSPRILECSSANEKSSGTQFNFSPKLLCDNQNSPKFFTPTDKLSPRFFVESSPKSVYYDSVRSPKFFPDTPKSPAPNDNERRSLSPKAFTDLHNRNNSPKVYSPFEQLSPKLLLSGKPRSPKVYSFNKENYFDFDSGNQTSNAEFTRQNSLDEVVNVNKKPNYVQRYSGRNSIERERMTPTEKLDVRKYRRHNSCDTYNRNSENGNDNNLTKTMISYHDNVENVANPNYNVAPKNEEQMEITEKGDDVLDCCARLDFMTIYPESQEDFNKHTESLAPSHPNTEQERRHRLKSISLDSDNAKIIEQNLGLPIAKHMKQDNLNEALQDYSASCCNVKRSGTCATANVVNTKFKFDCAEISKVESKDFFVEESKYSPDLTAQKKSLRDSSDTKSFIDMPRFSPKEFEVVITVDEDSEPNNLTLKRKGNKNRNNLTIDLTRRDSDLEKELLEFEKLYTDSEDKKVKTPTLKIKATSLDSSDSINLSLPQQNTLEVPQNSVSVPNTPKRYMKRVLIQKGLAKGHEFSGGKMGYNSLQSDQRRFIKGQPVLLDSGIFLRENHANLMLYQPSTSRGNSRRMGSFDENMADFAENPPEINISNDYEGRVYFPQPIEMSQSGLGSNLLNFKQNLSVSSTNLKTLPEGVPSNDFETTADEKTSKKLHRRGSNQSLMISLDCNQPSGKYSTLSLQSSNCSLNSVGASCHNLASIRNSASNFSLNTDNRQKKLTLERRNSNASLAGNPDHLTPITRIIGTSNANLQASRINLNTESQSQPSKNCLLQRRGSNNSLTLNIQNSNSNLARFSSNSSLNINKDYKCGQRKGLLERRSSNTSLTLNINNSNPQLTTSRALSISNYNLNGSTCNLSLHNSNQSIHNPSERKKGILERRSSNTSLTINIQGNENPRDIEIDEKVLESNLKDQQLMAQRDKHRKSLSTENLLPKSYKNRVHTAKNNDNQRASFGSHDNLWSNCNLTDNEEFQDNHGQNLTYVCGDQENEIIYAFGTNENFDVSQGVVRNITTKPLSPQTTSEDFKKYLANIQHLQNASSVLTRKQLKDLNNIFQNGYSKVKCEGTDNNGHRCSPKGDLSKDNPQMSFPETELPCAEYQKSLLRNLHKEFWDLPLNFQEKPMVFGSHPKNRYKTILPNEHSRFILNSEGAESSEGYVNANYIKGHEYTKNCYIATQGPLQNTIYDFWLMVHQNGTQSSNEAAKLGSANVQCQKAETPKEKSAQKIVMLTNFIENNRQKCEKYFPLELNEEVVFENPDFLDSVNFFAEAPKEITEETKNSFTIKNKGMIKKPGYTIRRLHVLYRKGSSDNVTVRTDVEVMSDSEEMVRDFNKDAGATRNEAEETLEIAKKINIITDVPKNLAQDENETIVYHYWFHNWADHKCPKDVNALLNLSLDVLKTGVYNFEQRSDDANEPTTCNCSANQPEPVTKFVFPPLDAPVCETSGCNSEHTARKAMLDVEDDSSPPTIVHCSAGIGRTGCLIAILNGIKQLNSDQKVDVLGIVCNMRLNRGGMVQNSEQYELIHKVLCLYEQICLPSL